MSDWADEREGDLDDSEAPDEADRDDEEEPVETEPCPSCGAAVFEEAQVCPRCGAWISDAERRRGMPIWIVLAVALALAGMLMWVLG